MRKNHFLICVVLLLAVAGCQTQSNNGLPTGAWRGVHLMVRSDDDLAALEGQLPKLADAGANALVIQLDYHFDFQSHPELRDRPFVTKAGARAFAAAARATGFQVIPELDCLGHQSWKGTTFPLLAQYPQFDETPGQFPGNEGIYCRSWCPLNPNVNRVVFALIDELADAFEANAFHAGMDEVFTITNQACPRCHDQDPAQIFAKAVNDLHQHIVGQRKLTMLMWADRLLDARTMGYGRWESAANGTAGAVDLIPKDIILCDWHYLALTNYSSVPFLLSKGFRVWPSGFQPLAATEAFSEFSLEQRRRNPRVIGYLTTTWGKAWPGNVGDWPPVTKILPEWK